MPASDRRLLLLATCVTSALVLVLALAGHPELLAYASPLLVLALYGARGLRRELDHGALAQLTAPSLLGDHGPAARAAPAGRGQAVAG